MRADRHQSLSWIFFRQTETPVGTLLEIEKPVAQYAEAGQGLANVRLHRSQVFADDQNSVPHTLQRQNPQQIIRMVLNVQAARSFRAVGDPEQAEEAHHVVDAKGSAMSEIAAHRFREKPVSIFLVTRRIWWRERPVLTLGREVIGRRAHPAPLHIEVAVGPQI